MYAQHVLRAAWVVLSVLSLALTPAPFSTSLGRGDEGEGPNRAGLVVRYGDGRVVTACVRFSEPEISGEELLYRAGLEVSVQPFGGMGNAVCAINGEGCQPPGEPCFCQCQTMGEKCVYWVYAHLGEDGKWHTAGRGPSTTLLHNGDVDGWAWGGGVALPALTFADICAAPATATVTPLAVTTSDGRTPSPSSIEEGSEEKSPSPTLPPATATPPPPALTTNDERWMTEEGQAAPVWGAYAAFVALGALLVGALVWLAQRRGS